MAKLRLGLDLRLFGPKDAGLGRYSEEVLSALKHHASDIEVVAFVKNSSDGKTINQNFGVETTVAPFRFYSLAEQIKFPELIKKTKVDLMHFLHFNVPIFYRGLYVVTIHDLILHHFPSREATTLPSPVYWLKYLGYRFVFRRAVLGASQIIAVSQYTAEDLATFYPQTHNRINVISELSVFRSMRPEADNNQKLFYNINKPYVLVVGNFYPHKNIKMLLKAWPEVYKQTKHQLILVGREDIFQRRLKNFTKDMSVLWLSSVSDNELFYLYKEAAACLNPSRYEGLGLPGLEALSLATSLISSSAAALPEAYDRQAIYIPIDNHVFMANAIIATIKNNLLKNKQKQSPEMDEEKIARAIKQVYERVLSKI